MKISSLFKVLLLCVFAYTASANASANAATKKNKDKNDKNEYVQVSEKGKIIRKYNFKTKKTFKRKVNTGGFSLFSSSSNKKIISYKTNKRPGSIIVKAKEKKLYYVLTGGKAIAYGIGVARPGFEWRGTHRLSRKAEWPNWTPPPAMLKREPGLKKILKNGTMKGGKKNPLGARALYIGSTIYRIHGTNNGRSIGYNVSSGCIRLHNKDIIDLYNRVKVGARIYVN